MAAGLGFKTFNTGDILSASDVNGYLMQGVLVFASTAARDAAITAPAEGQFAFTKDTNSLFYYDGAAWVASGATGDIEGVTAGVGISGGGTSGTVTVTNSMATAIDAKGDLIVGTGADTFSKLTAGTNGYLLTADSAEATGLKWAAAAGGGGGMTFIQRSSFSNVAGTSTTFDGVFTSSYETYFINIENIYSASAADDLQFQFIYSGTTQPNTYYAANFNASYAATSMTLTNSSNTTQITLSDNSGDTADRITGQFYVNQVGNTSERAFINGLLFNSNKISQEVIGGNNYTARLYTGFLLKSSSANVSGTVTVFGVNKS
jgi:hypothetical protein